MAAQYRRVPRRQAAIGAISLILAGLVGYSRFSMDGQQRTSQPGLVSSSKSANTGFAYKLVKRSNASDPEPTSVTDAVVYPGASGAYKDLPGSPPLHIHQQDDEIFEVLEGRMGYYYDQKEGLLEVGQNFSLPAAEAHTFWNAQPDKVLWQRITLINRSGKFSPSERFFEQWAAIAYDQDGIDNVNPLQLMLSLKAGHIELAEPYPIRIFIKYVVCPLAELLGYKGFYPEYIRP